MTPQTLGRPRVATRTPSPQAAAAQATPPAGPAETAPGRGPAVAVMVPPRPAPDWTGAACVDHQHLPWAPDTPAAEAAVVKTLADICADCPVRAACAAWAIDAGVVGIWGGLTTAQRRERVARARSLARGRCPIAGCDRPRARGRDMCATHYSRARRGSDLYAPHRRPGTLPQAELITGRPEGGWVVTGACGGRHLIGAGWVGWSCPVCDASSAVVVSCSSTSPAP